MTGIYGEAPPGRGIFSIQIHERVGISLVEVYDGKGNHISKTGHLQLLTVVKRDAQYSSKLGIRKEYLFSQNFFIKGQGVEPQGEPPYKTLLSISPPPSLEGVIVSYTSAHALFSNTKQQNFSVSKPSDVIQNYSNESFLSTVYL